MPKEHKRIWIFAGFALAFLVIFSALYYCLHESILLTLLMLTPAFSVILTRLVTKEGFGNLYLRPYFKKNWGWYLAAYFVTPIIAFAGAALYFIIFPSPFHLLDSYAAQSSDVSSVQEYISYLCKIIPLAMIANPIMGLIQCFGEEFAWRGYLLPEMTTMISKTKAIILTGMFWGIWHAPIVAMGYNYGSEHPIAGIFAMIALCCVLGVISSYLFYKTNSIWCSVLFHASINGMDLYAPSMLFMSDGANAFIGPDLTGVIGGIGFLLTAVIMMSKLSRERKPDGIIH